MQAIRLGFPTENGSSSGSGSLKKKGKRKRLISDLDPIQSASIDEPKASASCRSNTKKLSDLTKDQVVRLCFPRDRPRARRVIDELRTYLTQLSYSQGFDIDVYPGHFFGVTTIFPVRYCSFDLRDRADHKSLANLGITKYNADNATEFEVVEVEKVNVCIVGLEWEYYVTFNARHVNATGDTLKPFQTIVVVHKIPFTFSHAVLCRPKPN